MRSLAAALLLMLPAAVRADIGEPCDAEGVCPPAMTCIPEEGTPGYCTARCPEAGCPEGFTCRSGGAPFEMCLKGEGLPPGGEIGAACDGPDACAAPLTCFADNDERYCTRYCTFPGTCPEGFRCQQGATPACQRLRGLPSSLEPCPAGECAEGWDCVTHPSRELAFCALPCPEGTCGAGLGCVGGHCLPEPLPGKPDFGQPCVPDGLEPSLTGCAGDTFCLYQGGADSYCTSSCDLDDQCPEGYGCRSIEPGRPECRRGVPNDDFYNPMPFPDGGVPVLPPPSEPPMQAVEQEGGDDTKGKASDGGYQAAPGEGAESLRRTGLLVLAMTAVWFWLRRRAPRA
jgi:hypothetical protein